MKNEVIVPFFRDNPDSRCILFTKTRYNFQKNVFSFVQKTVNGYFSDAEVGLNLWKFAMRVVSCRRVSTEALKGWINDDPDMQHLNSERITGRISEQMFGEI